jgi:hypothetical protein
MISHGHGELFCLIYGSTEVTYRVISAMLHYDGEAARYDATRQHGPLGSLSRPAG